MAALGRISGPLLKANLERLGVDLAFETDLLYLNVTDSRIGINTNNPQYDLDVNGTTRTTNLEVTDIANIADITISGNTIETTNSVLNLGTANTVVYQTKLNVDDIEINGASITTTASNADLRLSANGSGIIHLPTNNVQFDQDLTVNGTTTLNNVESTGNLSVSQNATVSQDLTVGRSAQFENIKIDQNIISTTDSNSNLEIKPNGTGTVEIIADTNVYGNIHATGNVTADGDITIGDANTDSVTFNAEIASDIVPDQDNTYTIGLDSKRWANIWVNNFVASDIDTDALVVDGVDLALRQGNIFYVAENGNDLNTGTHQNDPKASIEAALSIANDGDTVYVYPGVYTESFPLTIKKGVTLRGFGIRSVEVKPTTATRYNDAILLNGESTIEDLTISDFYSGGNFFAVTEIVDTTNIKFNVGTAPFAHTYVSGGEIVSDDSTIANVSNAVYDHTTGVLTVTTDVPHDTYLGANLFLKNLTFSCNGGTRIFPDNGYAFRFATDFEVTTRSPYIRNVTVLTQGTGAGGSDPRGFNSGDAGKGAYIDGAYATAASREASMLFHSATFICPGVDAITATNGARIEWLNSFTYFANKSFNAYDSNDGLRGAGRTAIKVSGGTGSYSAGEQFTYVADDGSTILAQGTIDEIVNDKIYLTGNVGGLVTADSRPGKTLVANANAQLDTAQKKFGSSSLLLDGTGDYASVTAQDDFGFGVSSFSIETFVYPNGAGSLTSTKSIVDFRAGAASDNGLYMYSDGGAIKVLLNGSVILTASTLITINNWHHIALTRTGTTMRLYVNGVLEDSATVATDLGTTKPLAIGSNYDGTTDYWNGWFDELRVSTISRYNSPTLVVPASEFVSDTDTVLLLHFNGDDAATTFTDDSLTAQDLQFSGGASADYIDFVDYTDFGAEVRAIASAAVYGNYGIVGDGPGVIMYLISQNLAYIGTGLNVDNDPDLVIQANEIVELNDAKIRYSSVDHKGDFRVGDLFYVNQETGVVEFTSAAFNVETTTGLTFTSGSDVTFIDGTTVDTGNISIHDNTVETTTGDLNITSATGNINFGDNLNVTGNVDVTGNVSIGGNITIGDANTDDLNIVAEVVSDIVPDQNSTYNLGTATKRWNRLFASNVQVDDIEINDNYITTTVSNADLELRANGTGEILVPSNNVQIDNDLTVDGTTTLANTVINGAVSVTGPITQTGNYSVTGDVSVSGTLTVSGQSQFENILINDNYITTTQSNSDLELRANGTGDILIPDNNLVVNNNLTVYGTSFIEDLNVTNTVTANNFTTGDINIDDNFITTTQADSDLTLTANGTGRIYVPSNDVVIDNNLTVNGTTNLSNTNISGALIHVGNFTQTGNITVTGNYNISQTFTVSGEAQFENILINDNFITTTDSNSDLELRANGTGNIVIPNNNVIFDNNVTISGTATIQDLNSTGTITANSFSTGDILIDDNFITTTLSNSDLELRANGTGSIVTDNFSFKDNVMSTDTDMILNPSTGVVEIDSTASLIVPKGTELERPAVPETGMIRYNTDNDYFEGWNGSYWVRMSQGVIDVDGDTKITAELTEGANDNTIRFYTQGNLVADLNASRFRTDKLIIDDIQIDGNVISTITNNTDLEITANGTGTVNFENFSFKNSTITNTVNNEDTVFENSTNGYVKIDGTNGFVLPVGDATNRPPTLYSTVGMMRYNTADQRVEVYDGITWTSVAGASSGISAGDAENIAVERVLMLG